MLAFFDQYSNSLWSPNSQSLVFAGQIAPDAGDSDTTRIVARPAAPPSAESVAPPSPSPQPPTADVATITAHMRNAFNMDKRVFGIGFDTYLFC